MSGLVSVGSVRPVIRETKGSIVSNILGFVNDDGEQLPIVSNNPDSKQKPYYIVVFEDGCRFNLTVGAINYYCNPMLADGTANPDYVGPEIYPGKKYSMTRGENGMPIIRLLED